MSTHKIYLGDAVYVHRDNRDQVVLTVEYGEPQPDQVIHMEPEVIEAFLNWLKSNG